MEIPHKVMKKVFIVLTVVVLVYMLSGCGMVYYYVNNQWEAAQERAEREKSAERERSGDDRYGDEWSGDERYEDSPDRESGLSRKKINNAPVYDFGNGEFAVFSGEPYQVDLNEYGFLEFYNDSFLAYGTDHELTESIEELTGGEFQEMLSSPIINAESFIAGRRAVIIDGKQQPWTFFHVRLFYPDTKSNRPDIEPDREYDANSANYQEDLATIFANCDPYFVESGYQTVVVTSAWNGEMKVLTGYTLEEGTFLNFE